MNPDNPFLFLDYETGGLKPYAHGPASIAVAYFNGGQLVKSFSHSIKPVGSRGYCLDAFKINGLSLERLESEGLDELEVYKSLTRWLNGINDGRYLPVWAHNAEFDLGFYADGTNRVKVNPLLGPWGCTKLLSKHVWPNATKHDLNSVLIRVGLKRSSDIHGALEDATLGGYAYVAMLQKLTSEATTEEPNV